MGRLPHRHRRALPHGARARHRGLAVHARRRGPGARRVSRLLPRVLGSLPHRRPLPAAARHALPTARPGRQVPRPAGQHRRGDAHRHRRPAHRVRHRAHRGAQRLRVQRPARRGRDRRDGGGARAALPPAAPGGGGPRVRARPLRQLRHGHRLVPAVRHLLVARGAHRRRRGRDLGHGRGRVGAGGHGAAARLAVADAAGGVGGQRRHQPPARVAGRPRRGALHAGPAGAGGGAPGGLEAPRRRRVHPGGPGTAVHQGHREPRLAGRGVARHAPAARGSHPHAPGHRPRLSGRVRAAGGGGRRALRAPGALGAGAGARGEAGAARPGHRPSRRRSPLRLRRSSRRSGRSSPSNSRRRAGPPRPRRRPPA